MSRQRFLAFTPGPLSFRLRIVLVKSKSTVLPSIDANQWREVERRKVSPKLPLTPNTANSVASFYSSSSTGQTEWKLSITTTVFWIGEKATINNPVSNDKSAWDVAWFSRYGGYDDPNPGARMDFI